MYKSKQRCQCILIRNKKILERFRKIENEKSNPSIKKFFQKAKKIFGKLIMIIEKRYFSAIFLVAVLIFGTS